MGTLYLVATPIGNLGDISARALKILTEVSLIAAEDTRVTRKLLNHFYISTKVTSYFEHNKLSKLDAILAALGTGDVALVSDAGTPGLNDPGFDLVREAIKTGHQVSPIPGACAPVSALVASGLPSDAFLYLGYLPRRSSERLKFLDSIKHMPYTLIFLETPHRLLDSLQDINEKLGDRQVAVARELTKLHEQILRMSLTEARNYFQVNQPRGEFTLVVAGNQVLEDSKWDEVRLFSAIQAGLNMDESTTRLAARLASESGWDRRKVYRLITERRN